MANIKSAKKRIEVINRQSLQNKAYKTKVATEVKKYKTAVDSKEKENATKLLSAVFSLIDSGVSKGVYSKVTANRKKARLSSYVK